MVRDTIEYVRDPVHSGMEVAVTSKDLSYFLANSPKPQEVSTNFNLRLSRNEGLEDSSARLVYNSREKTLSLIDIRVPDRRRDLFKLADSIRLKNLEMRFPEFNGSEEDFFSGNDALASLVKSIPDLEKVGYELSVPGFELITHLFRSTNSRGNVGIPLRSYSGHLTLITRPLVQDQPERKLVLLHTQDGKKTPEFQEYKQLFDDIRSGKSRGS
jgi:hypothetical protein